MARTPYVLLAGLFTMALSSGAFAQETNAATDDAASSTADTAAPTAGDSSEESSEAKEATSSSSDGASETTPDDGQPPADEPAPAAPPQPEAPEQENSSEETVAAPSVSEADAAGETETDLENVEAEGEEDLMADDGEDDDFLDLNVTQSDEPSILERQIVAIVASGVTVVALIAGATFGALSYLQYQCAADVIQCNEGLEEPILGDQLFEARANVEQLALLADMAYLFAAASALVAITGFVRGFIFTGENEEDEADVDPGLEESEFDDAASGEDGAGDGTVVPEAEAMPDNDSTDETSMTPPSASTTRAAGIPAPRTARTLQSPRALRGSLFFEVE